MYSLECYVYLEFSNSLKMFYFRFLPLHRVKFVLVCVCVFFSL